jgi:hypothetical protein
MNGPLFWLNTRFGGAVDLLEPTPAMIDFDEIAESLGQQARFGGHTTLHWSVAEHSLLCAREASREAAPYALLHDAHEALIGDLMTPVKHALFWSLAGLPNAPTGRSEPDRDTAVTLHRTILDRFAAFEERHLAAIHAAAGLPWPPPPTIAEEVRALDLRALVTERRDLVIRSPLPWGREVEAARPFRRVVRPSRPLQAAADWIGEARRLLPCLTRRPFLAARSSETRR